MSILLPESFVDVSTMREIPDTQECWADAGQFFVLSLVFVWKHVGGDRTHVHADAGAHALCFLGSVWCLEYHLFLIDLEQSCFT